jgi:hypothetical protein
MTTDYGTLGRKGAAAGAVLLTGVLLGYTAAPDAKGTTPAPVARRGTE